MGIRYGECSSCRKRYATQLPRRISLMVAIGGGAPMKHDIRLGDVVVSAPRDGSGGVFQ
jgi:hypothetical protein